MVDMQVMSAEEDGLRKVVSEMPHEFLVEFAIALMKVRSSAAREPPEIRPQGYYHDKTEGTIQQKP